MTQSMCCETCDSCVENKGFAARAAWRMSCTAHELLVLVGGNYGVLERKGSLQQCFLQHNRPEPVCVLAVPVCRFEIFVCAGPSHCDVLSGQVTQQP